MQKEDENDPFVILDLPIEVKELFLFPVQYEEVEDDEKITYERIYAFGIIGGTYKFLGSYNSD